jgi:hypothetical protein
MFSSWNQDNDKIQTHFEGTVSFKIKCFYVGHWFAQNYFVNCHEFTEILTGWYNWRHGWVMDLELFISLSFDLAVSKNTAKFWSALNNNAKFDLAVSKTLLRFKGIPVFRLTVSTTSLSLTQQNQQHRWIRFNGALTKWNCKYLCKFAATSIYILGCESEALETFKEKP